MRTKRKYLLREDVARTTRTSIRSVFERHSAYQKDRSFFFFRSEAFTRQLAGAQDGDFFEQDPEDRDKLESLKREIADAKLPWAEYADIEAFGQLVLDILWTRIVVEAGEAPTEKEDWLDQEDDLHEVFVADRTRRFVGRRELLDRMHDFCEGDRGPSLLVVTGEPGCGKSALMGRFTDEALNRHPDWLVIPHFVGASSASTGPRLVLRRLCARLDRELGSTQELPGDYRGLVELLPQLLARVSERRPVLLIIDALNQMEAADGAGSMRWLPEVLPQRARVVVSTLAGEAMEALLARSVRPHLLEVPGFTRSEIEECVAGYLKEIRHEFPTPSVRQAFFHKIEKGNPLYILVALEELRLTSVYEQLPQRVAALPETVPELFAQLLERLEGDFGLPLIRDFTSFIACGRHGMTGEELQTLLTEHAPVLDPGLPPSRFPDLLFTRLRRALGPYLFARADVIDFFHRQLNEAVAARYLGQAAHGSRVHKRIAEYFEQRWREPCLRALDELPYQLVAAEDWPGVERVLCDLRFVDAKYSQGRIHDLIADYHAALRALPEGREDAQRELARQARLRKFIDDLTAYSEGRIEHLDPVPVVEPWSEERIREDNARILSNPTRLDRIRAFGQFVSAQCDTLLRFPDLRGFCFQIAYNSTRSGPVAEAAERVVNDAAGLVLLLQDDSQRPEYNPHPASVKTIRYPVSHRTARGGSTLSITADGTTVVSIHCEPADSPEYQPREGFLSLWDIPTGRCLATRQPLLGFAEDALISPDGKRIVCWYRTDSGTHLLRISTVGGGSSPTDLPGLPRGATVKVTPDTRRLVSHREEPVLELWDLEHNRLLRVLREPFGRIRAVSGTADGTRALVLTSLGSVGYWDLETGWLPTKIGGVAACVSADGSRGVTIDMFGRITVHDLHRGRVVGTMRAYEAPEDKTGCLSVASRGDIAATSAYWSREIRLCSLRARKCVDTLKGHPAAVRSLAITPDGRTLVSGDEDGTVLVWNAKRGRCKGSLRGHLSAVTAVAIDDNGTTVMSGDRDGVLLVWDVERGRRVARLPGHTDAVNAIVMSAGGREALSGAEDGLVLQWDVTNARCVRQVGGQKTVIDSLAMAADGRTALVAARIETVQLWEVDTGKCLGTLTGKVGVFHDGALGINGSRFVSTGARLWDFNEGRCVGG